jgi:hypothetical protein
MPKYKNKPGSAQEFASESQQHFSTTQIRKVTINNLDFDAGNVWKFYHQNPVDSADILLTEKVPVQVPIFHVLIHQYLYPTQMKKNSMSTLNPRVSMSTSKLKPLNPWASA